MDEGSGSLRDREAFKVYAAILSHYELHIIPGVCDGTAE